VLTIPKLDTCEVCGREAYRLVPRKMAGTLMHVCQDCQDLGESPAQARKTDILSKEKQNKGTAYRPGYNTQPSSNVPYRSVPKPRSAKGAGRRDSFVELRVVDKFHLVLQKCRQEQNLTPEKFANSLSIAENYYKRLEKGSIGLPIELAKRFEKRYHITLLEKEDLDDEELNIKSFTKKESESPTESMIYFRKRGQKPEYEQ
jgi:ribosome-binding protein aMBF1 (putative translation factor)